MFCNLSAHSYATFCLLFGSLLGVMDIIMELSLSKFSSVPGCVALGCFLSSSFRHYWGISNLLMGVTVIILTALLLFKLREIKQKPQPASVPGSKGRISKQANRNFATTGITIPVGPFYLAALLCAGACNNILHVAVNKDMQTLVANCISSKGPTLTSPAKSTKITSIRFLTQC
ncbi:hypothetical protein KIN20_024771 [Parelaphostrongylus tenuis]|uniref:Uncharacterized protein n=1 Tax=Parelaphostrongylus tenuis TaxID=148309 RepID=A0AAD5N8J1_PARTN|nr:hypothetical protein KIN20_024771 [Parelaphostrongylus tenuis]